MKYLIFIGGFIFSSLSFAHEAVVTGSSLYLVRNGFETHRAEFDHAQDCELIAQAMNEKEPNVQWLCSTSEKHEEFKCSLKNITIVNWDTNTKEKIDLDFNLSMTRGKASTSLTVGIRSFDYIQSENIIKLTNNNPYVSGNYFSKAISYITINLETSEAKILDFGLQENGGGKCNARAK